MAFIEKKDPVVLNIKLTSKGRELLAGGELDFKYYAIGDSEIDYDFNAAIEADPNSDGYTAFDSSILQPVDKNPNILSFISKTVTGDSYNLVTNNVSPYDVENIIEPLGFFTSNASTYITDSNHVKQPDAMIEMSGVSGGNSVTLKKGPTYGTSGEEPEAGDLIMVKWSTLSATTSYNVSTDFPTQNLWYQITGVTGTLGSDSVVVGLDRPIPNFSGMTLTNNVGVMIFYNEITFSGDTVFNLSATEYVDESILSFLQNSQCPTVIFPYWNMSIIHTQEIAGVLAGNLKYTQFKNRKFGGFVSYIQDQAPTNKRLGVVHYTNTSPANVYGEGFLYKTFKLEIPTLMWHKSSTKTMGITLTPTGSQQTLTGLSTNYYVLVDEVGSVVGKVFNELKIAVIEDQELLYAMEYKSNRNFTLPDYDASTNTILVI